LAKLRKEIEENIPQGTNLTKEIIDAKTPYLTKVSFETLRLYPPISLIPRFTINPVTLNWGMPLCRTKDEYERAFEIRDRSKDIIVPPKHPITIPVRAIHRLASNFDNPLAFDPERYTSASPSITQMEKDNFCSYLPFGYGARMCIGRFFALQENALFLIRLLPNFNFSTSHDKKVINPIFTGTLSLSPTSAMFQPREREKEKKEEKEKKGMRLGHGS
jgi:cytochrome P450